MEVKYTKKSFQSAENFPHELTVSGTYLQSQVEHREWDKDGVHKEMDVMCLFIQAPQGIFVARSFNPTFRFEDFKAGDPIVLPVSEYRIDNMVKTITIRV